MVVVDPKPLFEISPYLYMQFMEPLGTTDGSVEAAWDYEADDWREDLIEVTRDLGPGVVRFGGLFSRYYRWREGVGPVEKRPPMRNYVWGGMEANRVGTREFVDFCRRVDAEPLFEIAPGNLREYVNQDRPDTFAPREEPMTPPSFSWRFPAGSVSAVELEVKTRQPQSNGQEGV